MLVYNYIILYVNMFQEEKMVDFSGVAVAMQKLNKKLKKAQQNLCKSLEKLNKNQEKTK